MVSDINDINLPKKQVLSIFYTVQQLELYLLGLCDGLYIISLSSLLSNIESHPSIRMVRILLGDYRFNSAIRTLYSLSPEMKRQYENTGYNINFEGGEDDSHGIYCVIKRKS